MNADTLQIFSLFAYCLAGIFLLAAVFLFFKLKIKLVVENLSGTKAKHQIRMYRQQGITIHYQGNGSQNQRNIYYQTSPINETETLTDTTESLTDKTLALAVTETEPLADKTLALTMTETETLADETELLADKTLAPAVAETETLADTTEVLTDETVVLVDEMIVHTGEEILL